jgi:PAS domain S-box-containing protein
MEPDQKIIDLASERRRRGPRFDGGLMQILEVSRDLICLCRSGSITAINSAGARMLGGKTTEEMIGRSMAEFLIPEYGPVLDLFLSGMSSEDRAVPTRIMRLDGLTRDVELQVHRAREIAKDATVVTCRDLSDAEAPAVPARLDSRFHLFVENAMNLVCHTFNGTIRYINKAGVALLGAAEPEAVLGLRLEDIFPDDFARLLQPAMIDSIVAEDASVPLRLRRLDGTDVEAVIKIARLPSKAGCELMVEARDVSGHNRALAALRRTNEALEARIDQRTRELAEHGRIAEVGSHAQLLKAGGVYAHLYHLQFAKEH